MKIENYKGIDIFHDGSKDEFFTKLVITKRQGKKDEIVKNARLQKCREDIDKFLLTAVKKPVLKKAWMKGKYESSEYQKVEIILYNLVSKTIQVKDKDGKTINVSLENHFGNDHTLFISSKENGAIVQDLQKKIKERERMKSEISFSAKKLIPLIEEHFSR